MTRDEFAVPPALLPTRPPAVSVVLATASIDDHLRQALDSLFAQTLRDLEIVLVLDGVAPSPALPREPRLRVLHLPQRLGVPRALNAGIAAARSGIVARLDGDDLAEPSRLERQLAVLGSRPDVVALGTAALVVDEAGAPLAHLRDPGDDLARDLLTRNVVVHSSVLMRRGAVEAVGGYDPRCVRMQDYDLWLRLATVGTVANLPDVLTSYRVHDRQISVTPTPGYWAAVRVVLRGRRRLARHLGAFVTAQLVRDTAWTVAQVARRHGLRRPRYLTASPVDA